MALHARGENGGAPAILDIGAGRNRGHGIPDASYPPTRSAVVHCWLKFCLIPAACFGNQECQETAARQEFSLGGNSPSHCATTTVARQFPRTFTAVRGMSMSWSMPKRRKNGSTGIWN